MEARTEELLDILPSETRRDVCIEVSAHHMTGSPQRLAQKRQALREAGVRLAIDQADFGHSTLEALIVLEPDFVKINSTLVARAATDPLLHSALERLARAARVLNADMVALGVEEGTDVAVLKKLDMKFGQGSYFAVPQAVAMKH
jgi:EAL domain-containing protein (putative c-di-GMP-specific phosphodiesterase class I)